MDGSVVRSTVCSWRGLGFGFQHPYGSSQLPVTSIPGDWCPLASLDTIVHVVHPCLMFDVGVFLREWVFGSLVN